MCVDSDQGVRQDGGREGPDTLWIGEGGGSVGSGDSFGLEVREQKRGVGGRGVSGGWRWGSVIGSSWDECGGAPRRRSGWYR